jgi:hypothetical protein
VWAAALRRASAQASDKNALSSEFFRVFLYLTERAYASKTMASNPISYE